MALVLMLAGHVSFAGDDSGGMEFFENKIRPILIDNCYPCHSQQSGKSKGGLLLDSRAGLLKGGDTGPAIVPGDVSHSLLIKAVRYADPDLQMPPKNKKLKSDQIAALESWIKMGAPDPRTTQSNVLGNLDLLRQNGSNHWAFKPVKEPAVPVVANRRFPQTPVDNFVLAKLEAAGLQPSPRADKRTLIRRATFDLIGLPPTPEEVQAFEADRSPRAFEKVVDRLLASPHYGERWSRHWLDVARYADTKGYVFEEDRHYPYAYTYRDYVIRAFNEDLPYNQFIKEQIAADLITNSPDKRALAALGYVTLGRRFLNNANDITDDRIDVVCRGMMGLTVACARCHDHKFDPIPTRDYYSLYGIFASSTEPDPEPLIGIEPKQKDQEDYLAEKKKRENERDNFRVKKETEMAEEIRTNSGNYLLAAHEARSLTNKTAQDAIAHKYRLHPEILHRWIIGLGMWGKEPDAVFTPWFAFAALPETNFAARAKPLAERFAGNKDLNLPINPFVARAFAGAKPESLKDVADLYGKMFNEVDRHWQSVAASTNSPAPKNPPNAAEDAVRQVLYAEDAPANLPPSEFMPLYDSATAQKLRKLQRDVDELAATHPGAPARAMALADRPNPKNVHVFIRGSDASQGPEAPREFPEILSPQGQTPFTNGSGRLQLAEAIASPENPLTARVLVNRVWMHHFGEALVSTPSDFGLRSDPPTNPELLDFLAARFVADGWSIKKLHRLIMLSAAYQQSSDDNPQMAKIDPSNKLCWRMNRQRLGFEPLRDTLLAVSGRLDLTPGGHAVDITDTNSTRRTVYGYVDRQNLPGLFRAFDFASPDTTSPRRFYTTVPQQALFLMNNPFVIEQAKSLVNRLEVKTAADDRKRLEVLYELAFQRDPTPKEMDWAIQFIHAKSSDTDLTGWQKYAQVLLLTNELVFVD